MSYTPTNWQTGDTITASLLNKIESGVQDAGVPEIITLTQDNDDYYWLPNNMTCAQFRDLCLSKPVCIRKNEGGVLCRLALVTDIEDETFMTHFYGFNQYKQEQIVINCDMTPEGDTTPYVDVYSYRLNTVIEKFTLASGTTYQSESTASEFYDSFSAGSNIVFKITAGGTTGTIIYHVLTAKYLSGSYTFVVVDPSGTIRTLGTFSSGNVVTITI